MIFLQSSILFPYFLGLIRPTLTKVSCVWYNKFTDRGQVKTEYLVPHILIPEFLDPYLHRHGTLKANSLVRLLVFPYPCKCGSFCFTLAWITYEIEW